MVLTTFEIDGLFTQEDIDNRYKVYAQCNNCSEWTMFDIDKSKFKCSFCGEIKYDARDVVSLRTYNPNVHNKRKKRK